MKYFLDLDFQDNKLTVLEAYVNFLKKTRKRHLKSNCETIIFEKDQYKNAPIRDLTISSKVLEKLDKVIMSRLPKLDI